MNDYELMIVSKISETDGLLSRVEKVLKDANANSVKSEKLGKRLLAYSIKKEKEADFTVLTFEVETSAIQDLGDMLRLEQEALLRYLLIRPKIYKVAKKKIKNVREVEEKKEEAKPKVTIVTKKEVSGGSKESNEPEELKGTKESKVAKKEVSSKKKVKIVKKKVVKKKQ